MSDRRHEGSFWGGLYIKEVRKSTLSLELHLAKLLTEIDLDSTFSMYNEYTTLFNASQDTVTMDD